MTRLRIEGNQDKPTQYFFGTLNNARMIDWDQIVCLDPMTDELPRINRLNKCTWMYLAVEHGPLRGEDWVTPDNYMDDEVVAAREAAGEQTPHIQFAFVTQRNIKPSAARAWFESLYTDENFNVRAPRPHLTAANGSIEDIMNYLTKEDGLQWEYGERPCFEAARKPEQGKRHDLDDIKRKILEGAELDTLREEYFGQFAMHESFFRRFKGSVLEKQVKEKMMTDYENVTWKPWQQTLIDLASGPVQNRKVHVVVDKNGNSGKSFLANYLALKHEFLILNPSSRRDMGYILMSTLDSGKNVAGVVIDIARSIVGSGLNENLPNTAMAATYNFVEACHDGRLTNTKYESRTIFFQQPHVMIFTNHPVEIRSDFTLSRDRWNVMNLTAGILTQHTASQWE